MKNTGGIYLGLGTNLGDRSENLFKAKKRIELEVGTIINQSSIYLTKPHGFKAELDFYNQVIEVDSLLNYSQLLKSLKEIESVMGRVKRMGDIYESRIIDLDILDFRQTILDSEELNLPHAEMHRRSFVLVPLEEICPNWIHPILKLEIKVLIRNLNLTDNPLKIEV